MTEQDERAKDVLTSDDFENLEATEKKKNIFKRIFSKGNKENKKEETSKEDEMKQKLSPISSNEMIDEFYSLNQRFDTILIQVEKHSGKIEMLDESIKAVDEKIGNVTTQIGELRSTIVSRERFFDKMEGEFMEIRKEIASVDIKAIDDKFASTNGTIKNVNTKVLTMQSDLNQKSASIEGINEQLAKLKTLTKLADNLKDIQDKISMIESTKKYVDEKASNFEVKSANLEKQIDVLEKSTDKIGQFNQSLREMHQSIDRLHVMTRTMATKDDLGKIHKMFTMLKNDFSIDDIDRFFNENVGRPDPLKEWIDNSLKKGLSKEKVRQVAITAGWPAELVDQKLA